MAVTLLYPEEMTGRTVAWVSTGSQVVNIGFTDGSCHSIKLEEVEWDAKTHLERVKEREKWV